MLRTEPGPLTARNELKVTTTLALYKTLYYYVKLKLTTTVADYSLMLVLIEILYMLSVNICTNDQILQNYITICKSVY